MATIRPLRASAEKGPVKWHQEAPNTNFLSSLARGLALECPRVGAWYIVLYRCSANPYGMNDRNVSAQKTQGKHLCCSEPLISQVWPCGVVTKQRVILIPARALFICKVPYARLEVLGYVEKEKESYRSCHPDINIVGVWIDSFLVFFFYS